MKKLDNVVGLTARKVLWRPSRNGQPFNHVTAISCGTHRATFLLAPMILLFKICLFLKGERKKKRQKRQDGQGKERIKASVLDRDRDLLPRNCCCSIANHMVAWPIEKHRRMPAMILSFSSSGLKIILPKGCCRVLLPIPTQSMAICTRK